MKSESRAQYERVNFYLLKIHFVLLTPVTPGVRVFGQEKNWGEVAGGGEQAEQKIFKKKNIHSLYNPSLHWKN